VSVKTKSSGNNRPLFNKEWLLPKREKNNVPLLKRIANNKVSYALIAPYFILFTLFTVIPFIASIGLSFSYFNMLEVPKFIGLSNFKALFLNDDVFLIAVKNTLIFAFLTGPLSYVLCYFFAWLINELPKIPKVVMTLIFYAPSLAGNFTFIWSVIFSTDQYGLLNGTLMNMGILDAPRKWLTDPATSIICLIIVQLWLSLGASFLAFIAGFKTVDRQTYEAGAIDGIRNRWQELFYITLPQMKPQMLFGAVMQISTSFAVGNISITLAGFPSTDYSAHTIMTHIHDYGTIRYDMGYATCVSTILLLVMLLANKVITSALLDKD
jgi:multiple sugar transport system permease protein